MMVSNSWCRLDQLPAESDWAASPCLNGLNLGLGATTGANFLGACCCEMEMLVLPKDGVVSILADIWPVCSFAWVHMVLERKKNTKIQTHAHLSTNRRKVNVTGSP